MTGFIYAPLVALIVWYVARQYGYDIGYWQTVIYVLVAKVVAIYLKNDTGVEITVNTKDNPKEAEK